MTKHKFFSILTAAAMTVSCFTALPSFAADSNKTTVSELTVLGAVKASSHVKVSAAIEAGEDEAYPTLLVGVYSEDGRIIEVHRSDKLTGEILMSEFTLPKLLPEKSYIKAFVWDGTSITPLSDTVQSPDGVSAHYTFKPVKIGGGGWVTGLVIHPSFDVTYCRTDVGGVYRLDGDSWTQLITADRVPDEVMNMDDGDLGGGAARTILYCSESIGVDPSDEDVLFVACGDGFAMNKPGILLKSTNKGDSFIKTNLSVPMNGNSEYRMDGERIAVNPENSDSVFYGSRNEGLWRSRNGGIDWEQVPLNQIPAGTKQGDHYIGVNSVVFADKDRMYASVATDGIYTSDDGGDTWECIYPDVWASDMQAVDGVLYAAISNQIWKYTPEEGGKVILAPEYIKVDNLAVNPQNKDVVYVATEGLQYFYRTTDGGENWISLDTNTREEKFYNFHAPDTRWKETSTVMTWLSIGQIAIDPRNPSRMWLAEGMGVWRSDDISDTNNRPAFYDASNGIEELVGTDIESVGNGRVVTSNWDRVGFVISDLDSAPSSQIGLSNDFSTGSSVFVSPTNPDVVVVTASDHRFLPEPFGDGVYSGYSTDGGETWNVFGSAAGKLENSPRELRFGEAVVSAGDSYNMVWMPRCGGVEKIYYSKDLGNTWTESQIEGFSTNSEHYYTTTRALVADGAVADKFYAYSYNSPDNPGDNLGAVYVTEDGGETWECAGKDVKISWKFNCVLRNVPGKEGHLWFATGYDDRSGKDSRGLYFSDNGGKSFTKIEGIDECWAVGTGKEKPGSDYPTVFMYGRMSDSWGLYRSTDCGKTWDKCVDYPLGLFDKVTSVSGDVDEFGKVYVSFSGNGFCYGYTDEYIVEP